MGSVQVWLALLLAAPALAAPGGGNYGDPLFITPFLEAGQISEAQLAATVKPLKANVTSFSGYFTVNKTTNSNLFFWFFPAERDAASAPVLLWLQGGPGAPSMFGLFQELGPFVVRPNQDLKIRKYYWSQMVNMIFIDNPVGTGFSFADEAGYANSEEDVGRDLHEALMQFFTLFPLLQNNDFFVTGESYGGKYVPAAAYTIHKNNPTARLKINLKGISVGNGLIDPINMMGYGQYLYQIGLIDRHQREEFERRQAQVQASIKKEDYNAAFEQFDELLNGDLTPYKSYFYNSTKFNFYFNFLHDKDYSQDGDLNKYLDKDYVRRSIHVGNLTWHTDSKVEEHLKADVMRSMVPWLTEVLNNYRVLLYNGQLDIIVAYPLTVSALQQLKWCGAEEYGQTGREPWMVGQELAGYHRTVAPQKCQGSLTEVLVRNAGHMVPQDQPLWALDLIARFTSNKPL